MQLHFGVISGKAAIRAALLRSKGRNRQLAVCYASGGKLLVKIGCIMELLEGRDGGRAILRSKSEESATEFSIPLDHIRSVYPIREFESKAPPTSREMDFTADDET